MSTPTIFAEIFLWAFVPIDPMKYEV